MGGALPKKAWKAGKGGKAEGTGVSKITGISSG